MIQINDMFRLRQWKSRNLGYSLWWLEEWQPSPYSAQGRWRAITDRLGADSMDALLERMQCPAKPHEVFRKAAGIPGPGWSFETAGAQRRNYPSEKVHP